MSADDKRIWSWRHAVISSTLPPTTRHLLLTTACFMNDLGGGCYPTTKQLAAATGLSERCVCTHLDIAEAAGWLEISQHGFNGQKWKNNQYQALWPAQGTEPASVPSTGKALNVLPKGTERRDKKALNDVQSNSASTPPKKSARAREERIALDGKEEARPRPSAVERAIAEGKVDMDAVKALTRGLLRPMPGSEARR